MNHSERLAAFVALGQRLATISPDELTALAARARNQNAWFDEPSVRAAVAGLAHLLAEEPLRHWAARYPPEPTTVHRIGVVMAGNIPLVGFHDLLCVLVSGHVLLAKLSADDTVLMTWLMEELTRIEPRFREAMQVLPRLNAADAFIATGSDNTARYFTYYFAKKPNIIRHNRSSVAVLTGDETTDQLARLGDDILTYFGLGCRNVSTLFVPADYDGQPYSFTPLLHTLEPRASEFLSQHKYSNNYDYNRSIYLVNGVHHLDNGFLMITEQPGLVSPISVVYYQTYRDLDHLKSLLDSYADKIQIVASANGWYTGSVPFGQTQLPDLMDYADGVDTMAFLTTLA